MELLKGQIVIHDHDIGVIGAVTVEVDGEAVCYLAPTDAVLACNGMMGRTSTNLTFTGNNPVKWRS